MVITLTSGERVLLISLVENRLRELLVEIRHSFDRDFRDGLKREHETLEGLLRQLQQVGGPRQMT